MGRSLTITVTVCVVAQPAASVAVTSMLCAPLRLAAAVKVIVLPLTVVGPVAVTVVPAATVVVRSTLWPAHTCGAAGVTTREG